jgi:hypothetical protein
MLMLRDTASVNEQFEADFPRDHILHPENFLISGSSPDQSQTLLHGQEAEVAAVRAVSREIDRITVARHAPELN